MRSHLKVWLLSFVGVLAFLLIVAVAVAIFADANNWPSMRIGLGPLVIMATTNTSHESSFSLGPGLVVVGVVLATLNMAAARALTRRSASTS